MGFIGDYLASYVVFGHMGHNATAPCTHCGFMFNKSVGTSIVAHSTSLNSCNSAYRRTKDRKMSLREADLTANGHKCLGMTLNNIPNFISSGAAPLLSFASQHNACLKERHNSKLFENDGYTRNLVAPDHLITDLFKGLLTIIFIDLADDYVTDNLQIFLKASLSDHWFQEHSTLYNGNEKEVSSRAKYVHFVLCLDGTTVNTHSSRSTW